MSPRLSGPLEVLGVAKLGHSESMRYCLCVVKCCVARFGAGLEEPWPPVRGVQGDLSWGQDLRLSGILAGVRCLGLVGLWAAASGMLGLSEVAGEDLGYWR